jgi:galactonate dehydratase
VFSLSQRGITLSERRRFLTNAAIGGISALSMPLVLRKRLNLVTQARQGSPVTPSPTGGHLRIIDVKSDVVQEPAGKRRHYAFLRVETAAGLYGIGEVATAGEHPTALLSRLPAIKQALLGKDASAIEAHWLEMEMSAEPAGRNVPRPLQAAINTALWDVYGKSLSSPVYKFSGGPTRTKVRVYAEIEASSATDLVATARQLIAAGVRTLRISLPELGTLEDGPRRIRPLIRRMEKLRSDLGDETDLILDCKGRLPASDAATLGAALEPLHFLWLSDPCHSVDRGLYAKLSNETVTPLGISGAIRNATEAMEFLRQHAIDVIETPLAEGGGISGLRRIANMAETYYVALAPAAGDGPVATAAGLQFAATVSNFYILGMRLPLEEENRKMRQELHQSSLETAKEGFLELPTKAGLGIELDPAALEKYRAG